MRGRQWYSAAARSFTRTTGLIDAREAMVHQVVSLLDEVGIDEPPVDLRIVGSFQRVKDIQSVAIPQAGRLVPDGGGFIIQVNAQHSRGKQNFTVGHEIGHILIPSYKERPRLVDDMTTGAYDPGREEEYLCDIAAAELLMPMSLFRPRAAAAGFNLHAVAYLARLFRASREAVAIRLVQTDLWPCAVAVWHQAYKPTQQQVLGQPTFPGMEWAAPSTARMALSARCYRSFCRKELCLLLISADSTFGRASRTSCALPWVHPWRSTDTLHHPERANRSCSRLTRLSRCREVTAAINSEARRHLCNS